MLNTENKVIKELLEKTTHAFQRGIILKFVNRCDFKCSSYKCNSSSNVGTALLKNGEKFLSWDARTGEVKYHVEAKAITYPSLQTEKSNRMKSLMNDCGVFFAFSTAQFDENKTPLADGDKYVNFASGSYLPKSNFEALEKGFEAIDADIDAQIVALKLQDTEILYELENHECFYTGSISSAMDALGDKYSREQVSKVYFDNQSKYEDQNWFN